MAVLAVPCARAQSAPRRAGIVGVAFDSLHGRPLPGAFIVLVGTGSSAMTDANGAFEFDSVPRGPNRLAMFHPVLDSIGLSGLKVVIAADPPVDTIRVSIPSVTTLWQAACGSANPPTDSGLIFGTIRDANRQRPIAGAMVEVRWVDVTITGRSQIAQRDLGSTVRADNSGSYTICGLPLDVGVQIDGIAGSKSTDRLDLPPTTTRIRRRDLLLGGPRAHDSGNQGYVSGSVTDATGAAIAGARVTVLGATEAISGADGHFLLRDVPLGTRQLEVRAIGARPSASIVDVLQDDTSRADVKLVRFVNLVPVRIRATSSAQQRIEEIEGRRQLGVGHFVDSTFIANQERIQVAIDMTVGFGKTCRVVLDGRITTFDELRFRDPRDIALVEMERDLGVPLQYRPKRKPCWVALVWTKNALK